MSSRYPCKHRFTYVGVRYCDVVTAEENLRYYAQVYFCRRCLETRGQQVLVVGNLIHRGVEFDATPGTAAECGVAPT